MSGQEDLKIPVFQKAIAELLTALDHEIDHAIDGLTRGRRAVSRAVAPERSHEEPASIPGAGPRAEANAKDRLELLMRRLDDRMRDVTDHPKS